MSEATSGLVGIGVFAGALLVLAWLSARISLLIQQSVYNVTGSIDMAVLIYFLLLLPGIVLHEAAHWIVAKLLGLKPGRFTVWPKRRGRMVGLGSVTARDGGMVLNSLVGMAPLFLGTLLVALMARAWFGGNQLAQTFAGDELRTWFSTVAAAFRRPDAAIWAYLIFTTANGMMPSAPDREPVKPLLVYIALAALLYVALGMPLQPLADALEASTAPLAHLNSALIVTVALDIAVVLVLLALAALTGMRPALPSGTRRR